MRCGIFANRLIMDSLSKVFSTCALTDSDIGQAAVAWPGHKFWGGLELPTYQLYGYPNNVAIFTK